MPLDLKLLNLEIKKQKLTDYPKEKSKKESLEITKEVIEFLEPKKIEPINQYSVVGIDGSQIYPDRHEGLTDIGLINIATARFDFFDSAPATYKFETTPEIITRNQYQKSNFNKELVDLIRESKELKKTTEINNQTDLILLDGALSLEHLNSKSEELKHFFIHKTEPLFEILKKNKTPFASYLSLPHTNALTKKIKMDHCQGVYFEKFTCNGQCKNQICKNLSEKKDVEFLEQKLRPNFRTQVFYPKEDTEIQSFPFFYIKTTEVAKVEIPDWIAKNKSEVNKLANIIVDQIQKGFGYPMALAEAHNLAVVKEADKKIFKKLLNIKESFSHKMISKKNLYC